MRRMIRHLMETPQWERLPSVLGGDRQARNNAGGYVFGLDLWKRLDRFLVLGSEGGTYYVTERHLTLDCAQVVLDALVADPRRTVETIARISTGGRAPKNRAAIFALALAFCEPAAVPLARVAFTEVVRTGSHLFEFLSAVKGLRGFGRALRGSVADWYVSKPVDVLAYQLVKYRQRSGWTHRDALRLVHPKDEERAALFGWAVSRAPRELSGLPDIVRGFALAQVAPLGELPALVETYGLTHEMLPSEALAAPAVLRALANRMPLGALVRFLGRLSAAGLLSKGSRLEREVAARLKDGRALRRARLHPMGILVAQQTYVSGCGVRGGLEWQVSPLIVSALNQAFHKAFAVVEPSGKRLMVAVDVSGSMGGARCAGTEALSCMQGALALALVTLGTEKQCVLKAFSTSLVDLPVTADMTVGEALQASRGMPFGGTDCAQPMIWAKRERLEVDAFVVLTDSETWFGDVHPTEALRDYRQTMGIPARLIVVSMAGTEFTIADPDDALSLDVAGFDTTTPALISDFIAGRV